MRAFWSKILLWFFLTFLGISICFFGVAYFSQNTADNSGRSQSRGESTGHQKIAETVPKVELSANFLALYGATVAAVRYRSGRSSGGI
jgi:hypothetical protein